MTSHLRRLLAGALAAALSLAPVAAAQAQDDVTEPSPTTATTTTTSPTPVPTTTPTPTPTATPTPTPIPTTTPTPPPEPVTDPPPPTDATDPEVTTPPPPDDDPAEPPAEKATEETARDATAPGLDPPPVGSLDLAPAVTQATPGPDAVSDDFNRQLELSAAAVRAAQEALASAEAQLAAAQERLDAAKKARSAARSVHKEAARSAATARLAEEQAERDLADRVTALDKQREILGTLARDAYRSGGPMSSLTVVLESTSPEDFAASLRGVEAVLRSEDVVIATMAAELAELAESEARLQAAREERERAEAVAARALDLATQATATARIVARETQKLVQRRTDALQAAQDAQAADITEYRAMLAASQAVGYSLVGWAGALTDAGVAQGTGSMVRPGSGSLTSRFGPRLHPTLGYVKLHTGSDYSVGDGAIYAADDGTVVLAGYNTAYGNMTVISHGRIGGTVIATLYAHQSRILVSPGDEVRKADVIGIVGSTGYSTGPHLHFEVRVDGTPVDPEAWLAGAPSPQEYLSSPQAARGLDEG